MRRRTVIAGIAVAGAGLGSWGSCVRWRSVGVARCSPRPAARLMRGSSPPPTGIWTTCWPVGPAATRRSIISASASARRAAGRSGLLRPGRARFRLGRMERGPKLADRHGWRAVRRMRGIAAECPCAGPGPHVAEARWGFVLLLRMEGRFDEARRCLQAGFDQMTSPLATLGRLYRIDIDPFPIEGVRLSLDGRARPPRMTGSAGMPPPIDPHRRAGRGRTSARPLSPPTSRGPCGLADEPRVGPGVGSSGSGRGGHEAPGGR